MQSWFIGPGHQLNSCAIRLLHDAEPVQKASTILDQETDRNEHHSHTIEKHQQEEDKGQSEVG